MKSDPRYQWVAAVCVENDTVRVMACNSPHTHNLTGSPEFVNAIKNGESKTVTAGIWAEMLAKVTRPPLIYLRTQATHAG